MKFSVATRTRPMPSQRGSCAEDSMRTTSMRATANSQPSLATFGRKQLSSPLSPEVASLCSTPPKKPQQEAVSPSKTARPSFVVRRAPLDQSRPISEKTPRGTNGAGNSLERSPLCLANRTLDSPAARALVSAEHQRRKLSSSNLGCEPKLQLGKPRQPSQIVLVSPRVQTASSQGRALQAEPVTSLGSKKRCKQVDAPSQKTTMPIKTVREHNSSVAARADMHGASELDGTSDTDELSFQTDPTREISSSRLPWPRAACSFAMKQSLAALQLACRELGLVPFGMKPQLVASLSLSGCRAEDGIRIVLASATKVASKDAFEAIEAIANADARVGTA